MPADEAAGMALVDELQDFKTECYKQLVTKAGPQRRRASRLSLLLFTPITPSVAHHELQIIQQESAQGCIHLLDIIVIESCR